MMKFPYLTGFNTLGLVLFKAGELVEANCNVRPNILESLSTYNITSTLPENINFEVVNHKLLMTINSTIDLNVYCQIVFETIDGYNLNDSLGNVNFSLTNFDNTTVTHRRKNTWLVESNKVLNGSTYNLNIQTPLNIILHNDVIVYFTFLDLPKIVHPVKPLISLVGEASFYLTPNLTVDPMPIQTLTNLNIFNTSLFYINRYTSRRKHIKAYSDNIIEIVHGNYMGQLLCSMVVTSGENSDILSKICFLAKLNNSTCNEVTHYFKQTETSYYVQFNICLPPTDFSNKLSLHVSNVDDSLISDYFKIESVYIELIT